MLGTQQQAKQVSESCILVERWTVNAQIDKHVTKPLVVIRAGRIGDPVG